MTQVKRLSYAVAFLFVGAACLFAQSGGDFSFTVAPGLELPIGSKSAVFNDGAAFNMGASASLIGRQTLSTPSFMYLQGGIDYLAYPTPGTAPMLGILSGGGGVGTRFRLGNVVGLKTGLDAGWYVGFYGDAVGSNPYIGASTALAWDLSPGFSLSIGAGYRYFVGTDATGNVTDLAQGLRLQIGTVFRPTGSGERKKVIVDDLEFEPVFPVFYGHYDQNPLGRLTLENQENSAITDVKVYFNVNEYMEQPKLSAEIPVMQRGERAEVDLHALFRSSVLDINSDTLVQSEIITEYTYLGRRFVRRFPHTLRIHGRNSMTWDDDRKAASFVNPKDPTVLLFSKNTAGLIREVSNSPINLNLRVAMGIFEALRAYGMNYVIDPDSSYIELSQDTSALDTLLFPAEALTYRAGDCDDLSILYASLLESVGIKTAFITIPGHIYMAFSLDVSEDEARRALKDTSDLVFVDGRAWVPVEVTLVTDGFMRAWRTGARQWRDAHQKGTSAFYPLHEAWQVYEPAPTQTPPLSLVFPSTEVILAGYQENLNEFVDREVSDLIGDYQRRIRERGDNPRIRNRLGVLLARYGRYDEAEEQFRTASRRDPDYMAPIVNLGNVYFLEERYADALEQYERAELIEPSSPVVLAGLARSRYELERYDDARDALDRLAAQDSDLAAEYAYIGDQTGVVGRAAAAKDRGRTSWAEDAD